MVTASRQGLLYGDPSLLVLSCSYPMHCHLDNVALIQTFTSILIPVPTPDLPALQMMRAVAMRKCSTEPAGYEDNGDSRGCDYDDKSDWHHGIVEHN